MSLVTFTCLSCKWEWDGEFINPEYNLPVYCPKCNSVRITNRRPYRDVPLPRGARVISRNPPEQLTHPRGDE